MSFTASAPYLSAGMVQGLVVLTRETYQPQRWHVSLIYWAMVGLATVLNVWGSRLLSLVEAISLLIHLVGFVAILIAVWVCAPATNDAHFVFTTFINSTGWSSDGLAWCLGMLSSCYVLTGLCSVCLALASYVDPKYWHRLRRGNTSVRGDGQRHHSRSILYAWLPGYQRHPRIRIPCYYSFLHGRHGECAGHWYRISDY